jgi:hypothetical protein
MLLHQNPGCTYTNCREMSQRITGNLWWTNSMIEYCCQIGAHVLRWKGKQRTQTGTLPAAQSSRWGPQCVHEDSAGYELTVDTCQTVEWDRYCIRQPQNLDKESKNAENLCTASATQSVHSECQSVHGECHTICAQRVPHNLCTALATQSYQGYTGGSSWKPTECTWRVDRYRICDMGPFTWTWAEKTVNWMASPSNKMPTKIYILCP